MKRRRRMRVAMAVCVVVCLFAAVVLSGCHREGSHIVRYDLPGGFRSLDPQTANDAASHLMISGLFEGLFVSDEQGEPIPAAAESYTVSGDGLIYTFCLREDIWWSYPEKAGTEVSKQVTAADFVFAFQRLFHPGTNASAASRYRCIRGGTAILNGELDETALGVYAVSANKLCIELDTPNENFLRLLTETYAMPCNEDFFLSTRGRYGLDLETILSNGPFRMYCWEDEEIRLRRNENYREADAVLPDEVRLYRGQEASRGIGQEDTLCRLLDGSVDAAVLEGGIDGLTRQGLQTESLENTVWGIRVNHRNAFLSNSNIRQALMLAFDRTAYAMSLKENCTTAQALLPHGVILGGETFRSAVGETRTEAYDPEAAYERYKQGLVDLNRTGAAELSLLVNRDAGVPSAELFGYVSQVLQRELSLYIKIEEVGEDTYGTRLASGDFDLAFCRLQANDSSPWSILSLFLSDSVGNYGGYENADFDEIMHTAALVGSDAEALAAYREAERILLSDGTFLPMFYSTDYFVTRSDTHGIVYNPRTGIVDFKAAYIER